MTLHAADASVSVGIVGAGSLGLIFAAAFGAQAPASAPLILITRRADACAAINKHGIEVNTAFDESLAIAVQGQVHATPLLGLGGRKRDVVFVLGRSEESVRNVAAARELVSDRGCIVMLQNGLRGWQTVAEIDSRHVSGATYLGGWSSGPNRVSWTARGTTVLPASAPAVVSVAFERAMMPLDRGLSEPDIVWRKALVTSVNWLAGATGLPLHAVMACKAAELALRQALNEVLETAQADGASVTLDQLDDEFQRIRALRQAKGSAYSALEQGRGLEVIDILDSILERSPAAPATELLRNLAQIQQCGFSRVPRRVA